MQLKDPYQWGFSTLLLVMQHTNTINGLASIEIIFFAWFVPVCIDGTQHVSTYKDDKVNSTKMEISLTLDYYPANILLYCTTIIPHQFIMTSN